MHILQMYGRVCRVCFCKSSNLLNINEANEEFSLTVLEMLRRTVPALGEFVDFPVPQEICEICREQLQIAYRFQQICMATNEEIYKLWQESLKADDVGEVKVLLNQHQPNGTDVGEEEKEQEIGVNEDLDAGRETDPIKLEPSLIELEAAIAHPKCDEYQLPQDEDVDMTTTESSTGKERAQLGSFASRPLFRCNLCLKSCRTKDILQQHIKQWHQDSATNRRLHTEDDEDDNKPLITLRKRKKQLNDENEVNTEPIMKEGNESRIDYSLVNTTITSSHYCPNCNKAFKYAHQLSKHHCTANSRRQNICELCSKQFISSNMLQKHIKSKHKEEKGLDTAAEFQQPKDVQHNVKIPSPTIRHHVKSKHVNLPIAIENTINDEPDGHSNEFQETDSSISDNDADDDGDAEVDSDYTEKKQSPSKSKTLSTGQKYPCTECNAIFSSGKQLERHIKKHTEAHRFVCLVCSDRFKYPFMLQKHVEKHHPDETSKPKAVDGKKQLAEKSHICNYCPAAYTNVGGLAQHMSKKHSEIVPFKCDKCDKTFVVEEHLKIHTNRHMGIKNFKCDHCDKSFSFKFAMKQHMRIHTGDLNYLCTLCGKKFYRPSNLRQHMQRHGDDKPYTCPHCPKRFKCPSDRYIHLMSHQEGKNHVCSTCGARFSRVDTLHQHQILHTGEKPYKCDQCSMAFPRLMNLNRHLRTHTGEKPYKCKYCDKAYAQSNDLNKHVRTHVGENTYMCTQCPAAFKYQAELRNHEWDHYRKQKKEEEAQCTKGESPADNIEMIEYTSGEQIK